MDDLWERKKGKNINKEVPSEGPGWIMQRNVVIGNLATSRQSQEIRKPSMYRRAWFGSLIKDRSDVEEVGEGSQEDGHNGCGSVHFKALVFLVRYGNVEEQWVNAHSDHTWYQKYLVPLQHP